MRALAAIFVATALVALVIHCSGRRCLEKKCPPGTTNYNKGGECLCVVKEKYERD